MSNNPYNASSAESGSGSAEAARQKIQPPAIALIVVGVLNVLMALYSAFSSVLVMTGTISIAAAQQAQLEQMQENAPSPESLEMMQQLTETLYGPVGLVLSIVMTVCAVIIILGALKMRKLQSRGLAMAAAVLAMVPCLSPCCFLGLPFGIWALVAMNDPNVRAHFR